MIDLRILKDRWNEDGAREIFEELVLHCVKTIDTTARRIRPNPGDKGIDTFFGDFSEKVQVWQAKYFQDAIGSSQQSQIRDSWNQLMKAVEAKEIKTVSHWTLCIPHIMDIDGEKWWQNWKKKKEKENPKCKINLWFHSNFVAFYTDKRLKPIFDCALERGFNHATKEDLLNALAGQRSEMKLQNPPPTLDYSSALFVKKLELAKILNHDSARRAFYNFELLRAAVSQGGSKVEVEELNDLMYKVHMLWETEFHARTDDEHGRQFYAHVVRRILEEHDKQLRTSLPAGAIHKLGSLHYWADLCDAGWTDNFKEAIESMTQKTQN